MRPRSQSGTAPRPIRWPSPARTSGHEGDGAPPAGEPGAGAHRPFGLDPRDLCGEAGPELTRGLGFRTSLDPAAPPAPGTPEPRWLPLGHLAHADDRVCVELSAEVAGPLIAQLFGGRAGAGTADLAEPGRRSASWMALSTLMCGCLAEAFSRCLGGQRVDPIAGDAPRASGPKAGTGASLTARLSTPAAAGWLRLVPAVLSGTAAGAAAAAPEAPSPGSIAGAAPVDAGWAARARAQTLLLEMQLALEVARVRIPLHRLTRLRPGDVIPIEPPRTLRLMSGGRSIAQLPVADLGPGRKPPREEQP